MAHDLFGWQEQAVDAWHANQCRGLVEGMTGTGKTMVAIKAIRRLQKAGIKVSPLIVVPSIALLDQWLATLAREFPEEKFGRIGDDSHDDFAHCAAGALPMALVSTIHSAVGAVERGLFGHCGNGSSRSLLIADECHRYLNEDQVLFNRILKPRYDMTLGLSATIDQYEVQGLGKIVFTYNIVDAVKDGVIPAFDVLNVGLRLNGTEHREYLDLSERIRDQIRQVLQAYPEVDVGGELDWSQIRALAKGELPLAAHLLGNLFKRAAISYTAASKLELVPKIIDLLVNHARKKMLVFFERIWTAEEGRDDVVLRTAERIRRAVAGAGGPQNDDAAWCKVFHSKMEKRERAAALAEFREIGPSALLACRALDEGIDVPEVDAAMLVASTQSQRQRLQRIGRTLRRGDGNKRPLIVILYVHGTSDDNVKIGAEDPDFKGAATVHDAEGAHSLERIREIVGLVAPKPAQAKPPAGKVGQPTARSLMPPAEEIRAQWSLVFDGEKHRPGALLAMLQQMPRRQLLKVELASGKVVAGEFKMLMDGEVYFHKPPTSLRANSARKAWTGKPV